MKYKKYNVNNRSAGRVESHALHAALDPYVVQDFHELLSALHRAESEQAHALQEPHPKLSEIAHPLERVPESNRIPVLCGTREETHEGAGVLHVVLRVLLVVADPLPLLGLTARFGLRGFAVRGIRDAILCVELVQFLRK